MIDFYSEGFFFYFFVCHCFQLKWTRMSTYSKNHSVYENILIVIFPLFWLTNVSFGLNTKNIKCAWQKYQHTACLNYCRLYIFKICALWHATFRRKNRRIILLSKQFRYCCSGIYLFVTSNLVINCIFIVPDCSLPNCTKLFNFMNYS